MTIRCEKQGFARVREQGGFNLIEILVALCILSFGILAVASMQGAAMKGTTTANSVSEATTVAMDRLERIIALPYSQVISAGSGTTTTGDYSVSWTISTISGVTSARSVDVTATGQGKTVTLTCIKTQAL